MTFKEDWFKKINPKQLLPALQLDDGSVLTESVDICKYFCDQVGGNYLWPGHFQTFYFFFQSDSDICVYLACQNEQAKIDEAMADAKKLKWGYFAELKFIGAKESDERRIEAEKTMQEVHDLRFQERFQMDLCFYKIGRESSANP